MTSSAFYPYRSAAARDLCFAYLDSLADRRWPVASETRTVPTEFGETFVRICGPAGAPPVVLLHGAGGTSLMWIPNIEPLSRSFRVFAVDQVWDFGRTTSTRPITSIADLLAWMNSLFDGLQLERDINLIGLSYGGGLAAQYALRYPERVGTVVLLAPGATVLRVRAAFLARLFGVAITRGKTLRSFLEWMFVDSAATSPQWIDEILELFRMNFKNMQRRPVPFPPVLSDAEWARLAAPTLFLVGDHEKIYSPEKAVRRLRRVAPTVTAEIVPRADHALIVAQRDAVNRRILEFLGVATVARGLSTA